MKPRFQRTPAGTFRSALQYIREMYLQPAEQLQSEEKYRQCEQPEINGQQRVLPESDMVNQRIPEALHNVENRIQLKYFYNDACQSQVFKRPHNRRRPDANLQRNINNLPKVAEKTTTALVKYESASISIKRLKL